MYEGLNPPQEKNVFAANILTVFPNRDQLGRRILLLELGSELKWKKWWIQNLKINHKNFSTEKWKHKQVTLDEVYKGCVLLLEAAMLEPATQIHGAVVIFDMDGLSLQQTWQFTPPFAKRIVDWLQDSVPLRVKAIHVVNQPKIFNMVFALFKPFFREKLRNRIVFHGTDRESLFKHIDSKCLPKQYDGILEYPQINGEDWYRLLVLCGQEYDAINKYGYNAEREAKRAKKAGKK